MPFKALVRSDTSSLLTITPALHAQENCTVSMFLLDGTRLVGASTVAVLLLCSKLHSSKVYSKLMSWSTS